MPTDEGQRDRDLRARIDDLVAEHRDEIASAGWEFRIVGESPSHVAYETRESAGSMWREVVVSIGDDGEVDVEKSSSTRRDREEGSERSGSNRDLSGTTGEGVVSVPTAPTAGYRSPIGWARTLRILLLLWVALAAGAAAISFVSFRAMSRLIDDPLNISTGDFVRIDDLRVTTSVIAIVALVVTGIAFMLWTRRTYRNTQALGADGLRLSPGWAVWGWIVPIANLWIPKQTIDDIWRASDPDLHDSDRTGWRQQPVSPVLHWWWGTWLIGTLAAAITRGASADDLEGFRPLVALEVARYLTLAVSAVLGSWMVIRLTERQESRAAKMFVGYEPQSAVTDPFEVPRRGRASRSRLMSGTLIMVGVVAAIGSFVLFDVSSSSTDAASAPDADQGEGVFFQDLATGDCFNDPPDLDLASPELQFVLAVESADCDVPHQWEVFATTAGPLVLDDSFPGDEALLELGTEVCLAAADGYIGAGLFESGFDYATFQPTRESWAVGDRRFICSLTHVTPGNLLDDSVEGSGGVVPPGHRAVLAAEVGDCFDESFEWIVPLIPCERPHDIEVFATVDYQAGPSEAYPGDAAVEDFAAEGCRDRFQSEVDPALTASLDSDWWARPISPSWGLGERTVTCALWSRNLNKLEGSQLTTNQ